MLSIFYRIGAFITPCGRTGHTLAVITPDFKPIADE
jgi:hypothetical protein